jgi:hypothetical protein
MLPSVIGSKRAIECATLSPRPPATPLARILDDLFARWRQRIQLANEARLDLVAIRHLVGTVELGVWFARLALGFGLGERGP